MAKQTDKRWDGWMGRAAFVGAFVVFGGGWQAAVAQPSGADGRDFLYRVQQGDTLINLAERYMDGIDGWRVLQRRNRVADPYRLQPGSILRIPFDRIPVVRATAQVVFARDANSDGKPLQAGMKLAEDAQIDTGDKGAVTLAFDDGTRMTVPPGSHVALSRVRAFAHAGLIDVRVHVKQGEAESNVAPKKTGVGRYEISTPALVTGVRGTRFRVQASDSVSTSSVLEGQVTAQAGRRAQGIKAGFGVQASGGRLQRAALPAAPRLGAIPELVQTPCFRATWQPAKGAAAYRAAVARDSALTELGPYQSTQAPGANICGDEDGDYTLVVQSIDALGLTSVSATRVFTVRLHPEAPFTTEPANGKVYRSGEVAFAWASVSDAASYDMEVADAQSFASPLIRQHGIDVRLSKVLGAGTWWWRVRSVAPDGKTGPWSDALRFRLLDVPPESVPAAAVNAGNDGKLHAHWPALAPELTASGARTRVQLASESTFTKPIVDIVSEGSEAAMSKPPAGVYYIRTGVDLGDAASVIYSKPQRIDVGSFVGDSSRSPVQSGGGSLLLND
ncbi:MULTISPECIES: FecR family protein [Ralstonia]|nr:MULTISPECIES: FecR domain-containing protein [Ralstonia]AJW44939.1 peptidoglycan-binding protein LysM [Ralstonia mannitolilytica]MBU9578839.1 FecR domain-containing protein [Ralstonia mannitolilytica]PLT18690.1 LysM peptidoglycan-binding domain-containing protein [Ralstonia mannitolilytica]QIF07101.1 LysM peptidoglycan-binding domain-containing protein [Ralstonia mannitolilytica]